MQAFVNRIPLKPREVQVRFGPLIQRIAAEKMYGRSESSRRLSVWHENEFRWEIAWFERTDPDVALFGPSRPDSIEERSVRQFLIERGTIVWALVAYIGRRRVALEPGVDGIANQLPPEIVRHFMVEFAQQKSREHQVGEMQIGTELSR